MSREQPTRRSLLARLLSHRGDEHGTEQVALREFIVVAAVALLVIGLAFWVASRFVRPAPPDDFVMATGPEGGAYYLYGKRYQELLAGDGIRVELAPSSGSIDNLKRLAGGASVAFIQGGVGNSADQPGLVTLAALYYEPLWIFYRGAGEITLITQLSRLMNLAQSEALARRFSYLATVTLPRGVIDLAADALAAGEVDAALFVAGPDAPVVQRLLRPLDEPRPVRGAGAALLLPRDGDPAARRDRSRGRPAGA